METLENTIIDTCASFGLETKRTEEIGVWVSNQRKVASIGIHKRAGVTYHGMALNCDIDLRWFDYIVSCGLVGKSMTSLSEEVGRRISVHEAAENFIGCFEDNFRCRVVSIDCVKGDE